MADSWWDDFSNNPATDLAPLVSLLGESPTKQYISECLATEDIIIFAAAPIGVITAIVSAIRVCGTPSLRAFVSRAQEGAGAIEAELCSSTSRDVCELYNNGGIARVFGRPKLLEIVRDPQAPFDEFYPSNGAKATAGIYSFEEYLKTNRGKSEWKLQRTWLEKWKNPTETTETGSQQGPAKHFAPNPNLSQNIGIKPYSQGWFIAAAAVGVMMQAFVLVWAILTRYHYQWVRNSRQDQYAVPLTVVSTVSLCLGVSLCARLIESKTKERYYERKDPQNSESLSTMYWVQPGNQRIGDQVFDAFGYSGSMSHLRKYITSWKDPNDDPSTVGWIWVALVTTVIGFVCQFLGLRACHSSVAVVQFGVTIIMSLIRAGLRTQRLRKEDNFMMNEPGLFSGARTRLLGDENGQFKGRGNPRSDKFKGNRRVQAESEISQWLIAKYCVKSLNDAVKSFCFRTRLARITGLREPDSGGSSNWSDELVSIRTTALILARAIHDTMRIFSAGRVIYQRAFAIFCMVQVDPGMNVCGESEVYLSLRKQIDEDIKPEGTWKTDPFEIEALLGLWMTNQRINRIIGLDGYLRLETAIREYNQNFRSARDPWQQRKDGEALNLRLQLLRADWNSPIEYARAQNAVWWKDGKEFVTREEGPQGEPRDQRRFFGCCNLEERTPPGESFAVLEVSSEKSLQMNCAQGIYSVFLNAIVSAVERVEGSRIAEIQDAIIEAGLCDRDDSFACVIIFIKRYYYG
ncbi:uncharacterized protein F4822DRAFT_424813 [Hypoxylon trugodes]|uniref:uncharacterized protein n=1 Tax=Hypoxylon trugodes TaxID=326681 RepID=UPI00219F1E51|nr:uncharacterized protein F4822DRAFT_424813 [Hypoxylon trugodes]KAI1394335.1 hypothetical protein F4822DRAFT_424813 [Hypoxylon trugodes]